MRSVVLCVGLREGADVNGRSRENRRREGGNISLKTRGVERWANRYVEREQGLYDPRPGGVSSILVVETNTPDRLMRGGCWPCYYRNITWDRGVEVGGREPLDHRGNVR